MSRRYRSLLLWASLALVFIAAQGLWLRWLSAETYLWTGPKGGRQRMPIYLPRDAMHAASWRAILDALSRHSDDGQLHTLAESGRAAVDEVGSAYAAVLDVLTPAQRSEIMQPQAALVDPMFPGILADGHPPIEYCMLALSGAKISTDAAPSPSPGAWTSIELPQPSQLFWGIAMVARAPGSTLTDTQKSRLLSALDGLSSKIVTYHAVRATFSTWLQLPGTQTQGPPPSPFPATQELLSVKQAMDRLSGH